MGKRLICFQLSYPLFLAKLKLRKSNLKLVYDERSFVKYYVKKNKSNFLFYFQTLFADD